MSLEPQIREIIEDVLRNNRVVLFMKGHRQQPQCGFSAKTVAALDLLLPDYVDINVLEHPDIREGIKVYGNWPTIPQLYVAGELIGGSDIVLDMFASGELAQALGIELPEAGVPRVGISDEAATLMRGATEQRADMAIHLRIDACWQHTLSLAPLKGDELRVSVNGIDLYLDSWSASRADGLEIGMEDTLQGSRFQFDNPNAPPPVQELSAAALKSRLDAGDALELVDVRGPDERSIAAIVSARAWDEATDSHLSHLPKDTMIVFYCHKGSRSQQAAEYLRRKGFRNVHNLTGGIDAWSQEVDPSLPRY